MIRRIRTSTPPRREPSPDNWTLRGVRVTDLDSQERYVDIPPYGGPIHRFEMNSGQQFNTNERQAAVRTAARWAYAYMDQATAPIGVETAINATWQFSSPASGRRHDPRPAGR